MNNLFKKILFLATDFALVVISVVITILLTENIQYLFLNRVTPFVYLIAFPSLTVVLLYLFNVYHIMWEYSELIDYVRILVVTFFSSAALYIIHFIVFSAGNGFSFQPSNYLLLALIVFALLVAARIIVGLTKKPSKNLNGKDLHNVMVIGAGAAGSIIINDIKNNASKNKYSIKCLIDDDPNKKGSILGGVTVVGGSGEIVAAAKKYNIDIIIFAIPSCSTSKKSAILNICQKTNCTIKILPSYFQMISEDAAIDTTKLREVQIEDLLGRDPIDIKVGKVLDYVMDRTVLVTGGGGSIGSELCRQIACHSPKRLIIFDIYENNAYDIQNELIRDYPELDLVVLIGSVRDENRVDSVFDIYRPDLVFHAAAHKHVPLMENSPNESIKNNVFGTFNVASCADKYRVKRFVLISTDKAVNPTNIMGASKRICEMIIQYFNSRSNTEFVAVRFGNVLGSNGSVIPLFTKQIENGGPVTVTDPNIIRYFMTIPEAVSLVLQAGATANGGEIFVLDMGEPVKILDLAENLIRLSGFIPYTDIKIEFTGLRPGEKMYEEKLLAEEGLKRTDNRLIHIGRPINFDEEVFIKKLEQLKEKMADDSCDIRAIVGSIVPTYNYNNE